MQRTEAQKHVKAQFHAFELNLRLLANQLRPGPALKTSAARRAIDVARSRAAAIKVSYTDPEEQGHQLALAGTEFREAIEAWGAALAAVERAAAPAKD